LKKQIQNITADTEMDIFEWWIAHKTIKQGAEESKRRKDRKKKVQDRMK
jgi:hypothetical protein